MFCKITAAQLQPSSRTHHLMFDALRLHQPSHEKYLAICFQPTKPLRTAERPAVESLPAAGVIGRRSDNRFNSRTRQHVGND